MIRPEPQLLNNGLPRYVAAGSPKDIDSEVHGGMGIVSKMLDTKLDRIVAAKRSDMQLSAHAIREARILAKLDHPNIVRVYDLAMTNPDDVVKREVYFIVEWLSGKTLATWEKQTHSFEEIEHVETQLASALSYMHEKRVVYGDLKPLNIMFDQHGNVKLIDMGVSSKLDDNGQASVISYTPNYAAPEQRIDKLVIQSDIYSLAALIFELITEDKGIFSKIARDSFMEDPRALIPTNPKNVTPQNVEAWELLSKVFHKALQDNPNERYSSIQEFHRVFQNVMRGIIHGR